MEPNELWIMKTTTTETTSTTTGTTEEPTLSDLIVFIAVGVVILVIACFGGLTKRR